MAIKEHTEHSGKLQGCFTDVQFFLGIIAVMEERLRSGHSFIEGRLLGGSNLFKDDMFYLEAKEPKNGEWLGNLPGQLETYLQQRNRRADRYTMADVPRSVSQSFYEMNTQVGDLVAKREYRRAIQAAYTWLNSLRNSQEGHQSISHRSANGSSSNTEISFLFEAPVKLSPG